MRFGTSPAIVRVGRGPAPMPGLDGRGPARGFVAAPPQVRVGRTANTRTGADPQNGIDSAADAAALANTPSLWCGSDGGVRQEPLGSTRASVAGLGGLATFLFQPCTPYRAHYFTIPESFALLFTVLQIRICRKDFTEGELPAEAFSDQGGFMNNIVNGATMYPSIPGQVQVRNDSGAAAFWNAMFYGAVKDC